MVPIQPKLPRSRILTLNPRREEAETIELAHHALTLTKLLHRTAQIEPWFTRAQQQDTTHHTQLGTLNFLPIEIRHQIWTWVIRPGSYIFRDDFITCIVGSSPFEDQSHDTRGPRCHHDRRGVRTYEKEISPFNLYAGYEMIDPVYRVNEASSNLEAEIKESFFSNRVLGFREPISLQTFLQTVPNDTDQSFAFYLFICEKQKHGVGQAWIDVIERIPKYTRCVTFELGTWAGTVKRQLACFDIMNKRIVRRAPQAERKIARCSGSEWWDGNTKNRKRWEGVLADVD